MMRQYILGSRDWSFTCDIDWEFYHTLCNQESRRPNFFIKWSHCLLPVGHVVHRRNAKESPNCPACDNYEDHDRFLSAVFVNISNPAALTQFSATSFLRVFSLLSNHVLLPIIYSHIVTKSSVKVSAVLAGPTF